MDVVKPTVSHMLAFAAGAAVMLYGLYRFADYSWK